MTIDRNTRDVLAALLEAVKDLLAHLDEEDGLLRAAILDGALPERASEDPAPSGDTPVLVGSGSTFRSITLDRLIHEAEGLLR